MIQAIVLPWVSREPAAALWITVAAVLWFAVAFSRPRAGGDRVWPWLRRLIEALVRSLTFAALLGMFYFLLSSSYHTFNQIHASFTTGGSLSNLAWQRWRNLYGDPLVQQDLIVTQYLQTRATTALATATPSGPLYYIDALSEQPLQHNSIAAFQGQVTIHLVDPQHIADSFHAFTLAAQYEYTITNPADQPTRAEFIFPLPSGSKLYRDIQVALNGVRMTAWRMQNGAITWDQPMLPGQTDRLSIQYVTGGMDSFLFEIPQAREVTDFSLNITLDSDFCCLRTEPENGGIQLEHQTTGSSKSVTWNIDRAILAPRLGLGFPQQWPYAPYHAMIAALPYAARAVLFFLALAALTHLICGAPVTLRQIALLGALFALPFLISMSGVIPAPKFIPPARLAYYQVYLLPALGLLPLLLAFLSLRRQPRLPGVLTLALMALFMSGYVFIGLLPDEQKRNAAESMVQAGMIAYLFALTLYTSVRGLSQSRIRR